MDTETILTFFSQHSRLLIVMVLAVCSVCVAAFIGCAVRSRRKHDALETSPLRLTEDEQRRVGVWYHHRPYRIVFKIPASLANNEQMQEWVEVVSPRLGKGLSAGDVKIIPQRLFRPSYYKVAFIRLENLRKNRGMDNPSANRYILGSEIGVPDDLVSIPRSTHLAIIGESGSGKGSVIANIIRQEIETGGEVSFIDLKGGMEAAHYAHVLAHSAYDLDSAEELLTEFNNEIDARAQAWRGKVRALTEEQACHRLLVIDEASDFVKGGPLKKQSDHCIELIRSILSRSRALNCTVIIATQNPRVNTSLPYRSLLLTTVALRLNSKAEAQMALGEDAVRRGARPWQISYDRPGDSYLWDAETNSVRFFHVPFVTDDEIHALHVPDIPSAPRSESESGADGMPTIDGCQGATTTPPDEMWDEGSFEAWADLMDRKEEQNDGRQ